MIKKITQYKENDTYMMKYILYIYANHLKYLVEK